MAPLQSALKAFGATVKWDDYANGFVIAMDGAFVKLKPDNKVTLLNRKHVELGALIVFKGHTA